MKGFLGLTKRNLLIFFKDKQSVVFSLLTSIIVLVLYLLFLKGSFIDAMNSVLDSAEGLSTLISAEDIDMFANLVLLTGIMGSAMITVSYNCITTLIKDRENKIDYDILATPIKRGEIIISYFVSATISAAILTSIILTVGLIVIGSQGNLYMSVKDIAATFGVVILGSVSATAFFLIMTLFFKTSSASSAFFGMLSAASGFVIGAYIPISQFSTGVQTACNLFPASQVTIILRNMLMNGVLNNMDESLGGIDGGLFTETIRDIFTFEAKIADKSLSLGQMTAYVTAILVVCIVIQIIVYSKSYKKR